ncbi:MAG: hypothetical protein IKI63_01535 [Clostridia bacterium]|nr:hypothetical protein [Clostridia bacterium]
MKFSKVLCLVLAVLCLSAFLFGCGAKASTKEISQTEQGNMAKIVEFLKSNRSITGISRDISFLNAPYQKIGEAFFEKTSRENLKVGDDIPSLTDDLTKTVLYTYSYEDDDDFFVVFVTVSELGYGEEIVYTETGAILDEDVCQVDEWINDHWYISHSA